MHRPIFGYSFAVLVTPVVLSVLAFKFLNKKKTSARGDAKDVDISASDSITASTEANSDGSSPSPTKTDNIASSSSSKELNNGASSSLSMLTGNCYEVFLSFRGPDTRQGFTDHLYHGLRDAGIHAFRDDDELPEGENIKPELLAAIRNSKILIPILSEKYGTSSWCLNELVQMMECKNKNGHIVLPIFYKVKPSDVRNRTGNFGDAFRKHERSSFETMILEKWKKALNEVSTLKGYEAIGYEASLVKLVVRKVLRELKKKFQLVISENLVGIDSHVNKVMEFVDNKSDATLFVGIHGMGGIGKTTLAKTIYNKLSNQFEHRSFIANVRESLKRNGVHYLQNQLIYHIFNQENEVCNEDEGTQSISSRFKGKKVLVLLDDVDNVIQLKSLAGNRDWFSLGSKIIITTRNKRVLDEAGVDYSYEHKVMDGNQSLNLFSKHAFRRDYPPIEFEDLSHEVISITGGLPLTLEVFGSLFCGRELVDWRHMIKKLKKVPCMKVQESLRISYEALDYGQKQIFLDIACFFIGTDKKIASYMWDACDFFPEEGIEALIFMSLIKVGNDHKLGMHDQLRDLGREIVCQENQRKPWYRSRLWDYKEVQKVLKDNKGTDKIEAIDLSEGSSESSGKIAERDGNNYTAKQFKKLTSLRYLHLEGSHLTGDFDDPMEELRWLRWPNCPMNFEVSNFHVQELAILELPRSEINEKWEGWISFMVAKKLKYLDLSFCSSLEDMDFLSAFKKLEVLVLNGCTRLNRIDSLIGGMEALLHLELCWCASLKELPAKIGKLKALQQLLLQGTRSLFALPDSIGSLENLEILDISYSGIEELPSNIGRLRKLQELRAYNCINLKGIMAKSMCNLSSLRCLNFLRCYKLQSLPDLPSSLTDLGVTCRSRKLPSLSHLTHLKELQVQDCEFLECIQELPSTQLKNSECSQPRDVEEPESPQSLNTPFKLEILRVDSCGSIKTLDVSQFIHLRTLSVKKCKNLLEVQGLDKSKYLESLFIVGCNSIERLDPPKFEGLKTLNVQSCKCSQPRDVEELESPQSLNRPFKLEILRVDSCGSIKTLDVSQFIHLRTLSVKKCKNLLEVQGLDKSKYLESLFIVGCNSIERLDPPKFEGLKTLNVQSCECSQPRDVEEPESPQSLNTSFKLEILRVDSCGSIKTLDVSQFIHLRTLSVKKCKNLLEVQGLDKSKYLESLFIVGCNSIERLDPPKFEGLKTLNVQSCEKLAEIQGLDRSKYLENINIQGCMSIERLDLTISGSLKELYVQGCENLAKIQDLDRLVFLESMNISRCTSIGRLLLPEFGRLKKLYAQQCKKLAEIQGLDRLKYLERLDIKGCTSIGRLLLPKSMRLKELEAGGCKNLAEIQCLDKLEFLERLDISKCISIGRLDLPISESLKELKAKGCKKLVEIQGLDRLEYLERLDIKGCTLIRTLLLPKSGRLKELEPRGCKNLAEIQGLDRLEFLERLDIFKCNSIKRLDLPKSGSLKILYAKSCKDLVEIQGLESLEFLERLDISRCSSIERLLLPKSESMKILKARNCKNLVEIQGLDRLEFLEELNIIGCKSLEPIPELPRARIYRYYEIAYNETIEFGSDYTINSDESI